MPEAVRRFAYTDELHERMALKEGKSMAEQDKQVQRAALTADGIVSTATELIERDGLATFTMRSLGRELGASAMAVYGYFPSREALLAAVLERFMDTADTAPIPGDAWDDTMRRTMSSIYRAEMAHPELSRIEVSPEAGKAGLARHTDRVVSLYLAQGMPEKVLTQAWALVDAYLTGFIGNALALQAEVSCPMRSATVEMGASGTECAETPLGESLPLWQRVVAGAYTDEAFADGVEIIIQGIRALAAPDPCEWRTPLAEEPTDQVES